MSAQDEPEQVAATSVFSDQLDYVGWLILRGGLDVQTFIAADLATPAGQFLVAAIGRAEKHRVRELEQLARLMGGK